MACESTSKDEDSHSYINAGLNVVGLQSIYFSLVTQATVGYGYIIPYCDILLYMTILQIIMVMRAVDV